MSEHSKGPWKWVRERSNDRWSDVSYLKDADWGLVLRPIDSGVYAMNSMSVEFIIEVEDADAALIAAAPDLLAALEPFVPLPIDDILRQGDPALIVFARNDVVLRVADFQRARAAYAKATKEG